jgi:hypothetical protein
LGNEKTTHGDDPQLDKPSAARMYDYYLGGYHNFAADRKAAEAAIAIWPDLPLVMQANRAFLRRAVRFLVAQRVEPFLDIGSGIPTVGNVHEVAEALNPSSRVVYVDMDPIAVAHSEAILANNPSATAILADAREPDGILDHPMVRVMLESGEPVGLLLVALLHFVADDKEAYSLVRTLRDALPPGSYIVISHATNENIPQDTNDQMMALYKNHTSSPIVSRSPVRIHQFFDGFTLVDPGLVYLPLWKPEGENDLFLDEPERSITLCGVGHRP